jgi:hypothetical protein
MDFEWRIFARKSCMSVVRCPCLWSEMASQRWDPSFKFTHGWDHVSSSDYEAISVSFCMDEMVSIILSIDFRDKYLQLEDRGK